MKPKTFGVLLCALFSSAIGLPTNADLSPPDRQESQAVAEGSRSWDQTRYEADQQPNQQEAVREFVASGQQQQDVSQEAAREEMARQQQLWLQQQQQQQQQQQLLLEQQQYELQRQYEQQQLLLQQQLQQQQQQEQLLQQQLLEQQQQQRYLEMQQHQDQLQQQQQQQQQQQNVHQQTDQSQQEQYESGNVEEMIHGTRNVHDSHQQPHQQDGDDSSKKIGTLDVEHIMHNDEDAHGNNEHRSAGHAAQQPPPGEFKAGDVEEMIHGVGQGHVHQEGQGQGQGRAAGPYDVGVDVFNLGTLNVHDPESRDQMASAMGYLLDLARVGGEKEGEGEEDAKGRPLVVDAEHLMHGVGGHEHDVKQLRFLPSDEDRDKTARGKDHFSDVHSLLMHADHQEEEGDGGHDLDKGTGKGKVVTYRDIVELGLDESQLRGLDLSRLLRQNEREYDDWQHDKDALKGEIPEASFWEQLGELRKRYLSFGRNDGGATDLTGARLDPAEQKWMPLPPGGAESAVGEEEEGEGLEHGEDSVMHELELLGSTGSRRDRHKHLRHPAETDRHEIDQEENDRDPSDL